MNLASIGDMSCGGCTPARCRPPASITAKPHSSKRSLCVPLRVDTTPDRSHRIACNFQPGHGGRSNAVQPSVPLRKTAKTTVFYSKPKEAPKDTDALLKSSVSPSSESSLSASDPVPPVTGSGDVHAVHATGSIAPSESTSTAVSSSQEQNGYYDTIPPSEPLDTRGMEVGKSHVPVLGSSAAQHSAAAVAVERAAQSCQQISSSAVHDGNTVTAVPEQQPGPAVKLEPAREPQQVVARQEGSPQKPAHSVQRTSNQLQQIGPAPPVKITSRVKRPWEQVPKAVAQPVVVSEGADVFSVGCLWYYSLLQQFSLMFGTGMHGMFHFVETDPMHAL